MIATELTPQEKTLKRVLVISWIDGWSVACIAALSLIVTLIFVNLSGIIISLLIFAGAILELRGRRALKRGQADSGMKLLVRSQFFLLTIILVYCARSIGSFDAEYLRNDVIPELRELFLGVLGISLDEAIKESGLTVTDLVSLTHKAFLLMYGSLAIGTLIYQGGLAIYYRSKIPAVVAALSLPPRPRVSHLPPSI